MQNHFQDCPQYPLSCEKCGIENIPRNEVSSFLLEMWHTLSDSHLSGLHKWTVLLHALIGWLVEENSSPFVPQGTLLSSDVEKKIGV